MNANNQQDHPVGNNRGARFSRGMVEWAAATESLSVVHSELIFAVFPGHLNMTSDSHLTPIRLSLE